MERRSHERFAVNLNVALLDERTLPRGCRVRDVSQGGMLLQFERAAGGNHYAAGDPVKVRVSLKEGEARTVLLFPAVVRRVEEQGLGVAFQRPAPELMQLVEPYKLDTVAATGAAVEFTAAAGDGAPGRTGTPHTGTRAQPRYQPAADTRDRLARRITALRRAVSGGVQPATPAPGPGAASERRLLQIGLLSLAVAVAVVVFHLATSSTINRRLNALERAGGQQAETLAGLQIRVAANRRQERRLAELDTHVDELAVAVAALETGRGVAITVDATGTPPADPTPPGPAALVPAPPATGSGQEPPPADGSGPVPGVDKAPGPTAGGPWVLNLVSLFDQAAADRFTARGRAAGIPLEQHRAMVNGRPVWRVQVGGFDSQAAASRYADTNRRKLNLESVWIFKR